MTGAASDDEGEGAGRVRVPLRAFEEKAREYGVENLSDFYAAPLFGGNGFRVDGDAIVYTSA